MKTILIALISFFSILSSWAQDQYTVSGYIKDASNGEALIGASIFVTELSSGTTTNVYGFYSLRLPREGY